MWETKDVEKQLNCWAWVNKQRTLVFVSSYQQKFATNKQLEADVIIRNRSCVVVFHSKSVCSKFALIKSWYNSCCIQRCTRVNNPGGVKALQTKLPGGVPYFGSYCIFINKSFQICLGGVSYVNPAPSPFTCVNLWLHHLHTCTNRLLSFKEQLITIKSISKCQGKKNEANRRRP